MAYLRPSSSWRAVSSALGRAIDEAANSLCLRSDGVSCLWLSFWLAWILNLALFLRESSSSTKTFLHMGVRLALRKAHSIHPLSTTFMG